MGATRQGTMTWSACENHDCTRIAIAILPSGPPLPPCVAMLAAAFSSSSLSTSYLSPSSLNTQCFLYHRLSIATERRQFLLPLAFHVRDHDSSDCRGDENCDDGGDSGYGSGSGGGGFDGPGNSGNDAFDNAGGLSLLGSLWERYMDLLEAHPLIVKGLTAGSLNLFADFICQVFFEKAEQIDVQRILSFSALGLFLSGPSLHLWYGLLPKIIPVPGFPGLLLRLGADQLVFTPAALGCFFVALCTLEGRHREVKTKLKKDLLPLVVANWKVWIPFQLINFGLIPSQLQVAATSLMGVSWSIFISFIGHN